MNNGKPYKNMWGVKEELCCKCKFSKKVIAYGDEILMCNKSVAFYKECFIERSNGKCGKKGKNFEPIERLEV